MHIVPAGSIHIVPMGIQIINVSIQIMPTYKNMHCRLNIAQLIVLTEVCLYIKQSNGYRDYTHSYAVVPAGSIHIIPIGIYSDAKQKKRVIFFFFF